MAGAGATFDGSLFTLETRVSADQLFPPLTARANAIVEISFQLDSNFEVLVSDVTSTDEFNYSFDPFLDSSTASNTLRFLDDNTLIQLGDLSGQIIGPGNYVLRGESNVSANSEFASARASTIGSLELLAVPEPSSLLGLSMFFVGFLARRGRQSSNALIL